MGRLRKKVEKDTISSLGIDLKKEEKREGGTVSSKGVASKEGAKDPRKLRLKTSLTTRSDRRCLMNRLRDGLRE